MVELEGLEPAEAGNREGQSEWAFGDTPDHEIFSMFRQLAGAGTWYWHGGTQTTSAGWYSHDDYKEIIMPFALEAASAKGGQIGLTWQESGNLLNQGLTKELIKPISSNLKDFLSRTFDGGEGNFFGIGEYRDGIVVDAVANVGAGRMRTINSQRYSSASGLCTTTDELSPVFLFTGAIYNAISAPKMGVFYRAMSNAEFAALENSGGLSHVPGKELFVSTSAGYSRAYLQKSGYDVLVRFKMQPGAMNYFQEIGVMHRTAAGASGWAGRGNLLWKSEQGVMNLGIQSNTHLFNPFINSFKIIK
jgi:hypothetical protein